MYGEWSRCALLTGVGPVPIQPVSDSPSHSHIGCRIRLLGRSSGSTVATVAHTIRWAISTNAGATAARSVMRCIMADPSARKGLQRERAVAAHVVDHPIAPAADAVRQRVRRQPAVMSQV